MEGDIACGILTATYGDYITATFGTWRKETLRTWRQEGAGPPAYTYEIDLDPWSWTVAPTLGGAAFAIHKKTDGPRITGIRVVPPSFDVHAYNQMRSNESKPTSGDTAKKIAQDHYRQTNKTSRERHPEEEKQKARDERKRKQAEMEAKTSERYKDVFASRKTEPQTYEAGSEIRPSHAPVNFGMLSVMRNTIPIFDKGSGKGDSGRPLSPVKEGKKTSEDETKTSDEGKKTTEGKTTTRSKPPPALPKKTEKEKKDDEVKKSGPSTPESSASSKTSGGKKPSK